MVQLNREYKEEQTRIRAYLLSYDLIKYYSKMGTQFESFESPGLTDEFTTSEGDFAVYGKPGRNSLTFTVHKHPDGWIVRNALVPEDMQRQKVGTNFYIEMNKLSLTETGKPLRSTRPRRLSNGMIIQELSDAGTALWDSLVRQGLVKKMGEKDYVFKVA